MPASGFTLSYTSGKHSSAPRRARVLSSSSWLKRARNSRSVHAMSVYGASQPFTCTGQRSLTCNK
eukprot:4075273-Pleurochrysis_carterae.AAC.1